MFRQWPRSRGRARVAPVRRDQSGTTAAAQPLDLLQGTIGCHEIDAVQRSDGRMLAVCARNLVDDHQAHQWGGRSTRLDATDPASPQLTAEWSLNLDPNQGTGCLPVQFAHSASFEDGSQSLYVSYWDAGTVHLDVSAPGSPVVVSRTRIIPPDEDGDNHFMTLANSGR